MASPGFSRGTLAGTVINTTATLDYQDATSSRRTATSNTASVTVAAAPSLAVTPQSGDITGQPGQVTYQPVLLTNLGNLTDTISLSLISSWPAQLLLDDGAGGGIAGDGIHQPGEINPCPYSVRLGPNASLRLLLAHTLPTNQSGSDTVQFKAASQTDPTASASGSYRASVTASIGAVSGTVKDQQSGTALQGATVAALISGSVVGTSTTDASGSYRLSVGAGTYNLRASASGHVDTWAVGVSVTAGGTASANFSLSQSRFQGMVTDAGSASPLAGVTVKALQSGVQKGLSTTDSGGNYWLSLPAGSYDLQVTKTGYAGQTRASTVAVGQIQSENFSLSSSLSGGFNGTVTNMLTGARISGATVQAWLSNSVVASATSDGSGSYQMQAPAGSYTMRARASGFVDQWIPGCSLTDGGSSTVNFRLGPAWFKGKVTAADSGLAVSGASVRAIQGATTVGSNTTDSKGNYWICVPAGSYALQVSKGGYASQNRTSTVAVGQIQSENFSLSSSPSGAFTGTVIDTQTGSPIAGAAVEVRVGRSVTATTTSNASGFYQVLLPEGTYDLRSGAAGHVDSWMMGYSALIGTTTEVNFSLSQSRFFGRVVDSATGAPIAGATVKGLKGGVQQAAVTTNSDGYYWLNVLAGSYDLQVTKAGYVGSARSSSVAVAQVETENFALSTSTSGMFRGAVVDIRTGSRIAGATVQAWLYNSVVASATTDASGVYQMQVPPGSYTMRASASGYVDGWVPNCSVSSGGTTTVNFYLGQSWFKGKVTAASSGIAISGATVRAIQGGSTVASATTDSNGNYWMCTPAGSYTLQVSKSGYLTQNRSSSVGPGQVQTENFKL